MELERDILSIIYLSLYPFKNAYKNIVIIFKDKEIFVQTSIIKRENKGTQKLYNETIFLHGREEILECSLH